MKVLHLTTHLNMGGITVYLLKLAGPLSQQGIEMQVLSSGGSLQPEFQKKLVKTYDLPIKTKSELDPKLYLVLPKLISLIKNEKIDLLHAHTRVTQILAFWAHRILGIPYVVTAHGFFKPRLGRKIFPAWGNATIAISEPVADSLRKDFRISSSRIHTIFNGVDIDQLCASYNQLSKEEAKKACGLLPQDYVVGNIARLVALKGHAYLVEAFARVCKKIPHAKLLIVGEGETKELLQKRVGKLELTERVKFLGTVKEVSTALAAMDVFVFPPIAREGFGLSVVEAMACKVPIIATRMEALTSFIIDQKNGLLVKPRNSETLAEAILLLQKDENLREALVEEAFQLVLKEFSIHRVARQMADLYRSFPLKTL